MMDIKFKICDCPPESWEVIVVDNDEHFHGQTTIYYHCDKCGEDYIILSFRTGKILYLNPKFSTTKTNKKVG